MIGSSRRAAGLGIVALCALGGWAACSVYGEDLLLPASPADAGADGDDEDAALDAGGDADPCAHARWPGPPAADDPSTTPAVTFVDALSSIDIGIRTDGGAVPALGFDLDGVCTCPGPESCSNAPGVAPKCDDDAGRDDTGGALLRSLAGFSLFDPSSMNQHLQNGDYGLLVAVRDWNGQPNDTQVTVVLYGSNGLAGVEDGGHVGPTKGDGTDRWTIDPGSLIGGSNLEGVDCHANTQCVPLYYDDAAYVSGGVLVGSVDFPLTLGSTGGSSSVVLNLTGSRVTATIAKSTGGYRLNAGQLVGRWSTRALLTSLAVLHDPLASGQFLCGADSTYQGLKKQICGSTDIETDPRSDDTGAKCNALSVGLAFTGAPALLAEVYSPGAQTAGCNDGGAAYSDDCP